MKKILCLLFSSGIFISLQLSGQITFTNLGFESQHTDVSLMDWDSDGDLDILISGESGGNNVRAFLNNGTGVYTVATVPFAAVTRSALSWNDINQDGRPDLLQSGFGAGPYVRVFNTVTPGVFTENPLVLPQMAPTSGFADLNNDGYIDIYVFGNDNTGKSKLLFNDKTGGFIDQHTFDAYNFSFDPDVSVVDYDNDKDLDLFVTVGDVTGSRFSRVFANNNGVFTESITIAPEKGYGSSVWGDYNGDGYLDLLLNGNGVPGDDFKYRLHRNNAGASFTEIGSYIYGQFSTGDGGRFLDWDNDGDLDFVATGWTGSRQATAVYINNAGVFTEYVNNAAIPGVSESSMEVGDVDNDSDLDLVITGFSGNDFDGAAPVGPFNANVSLIIRNPATFVNVAPTPPTGLSISGSQAAITFTWNPATDLTTPQNALSYNMFLVNDQGKTFMYALADTLTGKLRLQKLGNVQLNKGWIIKGLPAGNYRWGVQAVDNSFMASAFTKANFTVNANGTLPVTLLTYNVKAEGKKARIEWSTSFELNNDRFEIERSGDGVNFNLHATVPAIKSGAQQYVVYDNNPSNGTNYYRLLQYDKDGTAKNHGIKTINFKTEGYASVITYPNPAYSEVGIRLSNFTGNELRITMYDLMGKTIHAETIAVTNSQGYYPLQLKTKPVSGQYVISVSGEGLKESLKVVVK